jgi:hypothetical protein
MHSNRELVGMAAIRAADACAFMEMSVSKTFRVEA